jgi:Kef-type K+ transport system membrane component KefB
MVRLGFILSAFAFILYFYLFFVASYNSSKNDTKWNHIILTIAIILTAIVAYIFR